MASEQCVQYCCFEVFLCIFMYLGIFNVLSESHTFLLTFMCILFLFDPCLLDHFM
jgi:hypothetical protein